MSARTLITQQLTACPACGVDIHAQVQVELTLGAAVMNGDNKEVPATARVTGVRVEHDCMPKVTRGGVTRGGAA